ncbi:MULTISPECIES: tripartite tricarboxylate transporter TctB family protein [Brevibacillus]|jgi:vacuolar-type H+-ATPase subunit I/STV1|uniref:tripartite tricarboxylate transporter TctB family protein n=1 Tax=Brevibacillus TaxID=55080 RepID=UPI000F073DE0|nr:tripartite tricarboxylate transporter TctB family protein [Brevibacillus borstelensis]MCM3591141.1 tripartite tricarboxylate transporter TctB family protein [Brevibacillus borstelensis]MED1874074.1 tripartite tricarboxylate transporter TctB family protein [Brevibacillus borstelensis]MED1882158.1 tripartite tricarboxylate transporter TctB family protein [Brevibacillus borstelensis]MED2009608.1 tripartite tricarboxylate transporter TctB family protein [Brevibacillus borstelensis]NOU54273.1 tr
MGEIVFHVLLIGAIGYFFKESLFIDTARASDPIGPAGFPQGILILAILLALFSLFQTIRKRKKSTGEQHRPPELSKEFVGLLVSIAAFVLAVDIIGFLIACFLLLLVLLLLLGEKKVGKVVGLSGVISISFTLLFGNLLSVPLPRGVEALKTLSYYIY